jgi:hypothetical protein
MGPRTVYRVWVKTIIKVFNFKTVEQGVVYPEVLVVFVFRRNKTILF